MFVTNLDKNQGGTPQVRWLRPLSVVMAPKNYEIGRQLDSAILLLKKNNQQPSADDINQVLALLNSAKRDLVSCGTPSTSLNKKAKHTPPFGVDSDEDMETDSIQSLKNFIRQCHQETRDSISNPKSYASAVSEGNSQNPFSNPVKQSKSHEMEAIFVEKSQGEEKLTGKTLLDLLNDLPCIKNGPVGVEAIPKPDHLILKIRRTEECNLLTTELSNAGFIVKPLRKKFPQLKVLYVPNSINNTDFELDLKKKNVEFDLEDVKVVGQRRNRKDESTRTVILKVTNQIADKFIKKSGRIYLRHQTHPVILDDQLVQCWNCRAFGHTSSKCRNPPNKDSADSLCPKCGEIHSQNRVCTTFSCTNCKKENEKFARNPNRKQLDIAHSSADYKKCGVAKRLRANLLATIYGYQ